MNQKAATIRRCLWGSGLVFACWTTQPMLAQDAVVLIEYGHSRGKLGKNTLRYLEQSDVLPAHNALYPIDDPQRTRAAYRLATKKPVQSTTQADRLLFEIRPEGLPFGVGAFVENALSRTRNVPLLGIATHGAPTRHVVDNPAGLFIALQEHGPRSETAELLAATTGTVPLRYETKGVFLTYALRVRAVEFYARLGFGHTKIYSPSWMNDSGAFGSSNMVRGIGMLGARFYLGRAFLFLEAFSYSQYESFRERGFKDYGVRAGFGVRLALDLD